jgi:hypothetical protein
MGVNSKLISSTPKTKKNQKIHEIQKQKQKTKTNKKKLNVIND